MSDIKTISFSNVKKPSSNNPIKNNTIENNKNIKIQGTNNRYLIKRILGEEKPDGKSRIIKNKKDSEIINKELPYSEQLSILMGLDDNNDNTESEMVYIKSLFRKEIKNKIKSYKSQDLKKNQYNPNQFLTEEVVIKNMINSNLRCIYCNNELLILYNKVRYKFQWTIDRIDNEEGHNNNNICISCLECNLNRRRRDYDKYLLSKQIKNIEKEKDTIFSKYDECCK
jgi:hypothetical protein